MLSVYVPVLSIRWRKYAERCGVVLHSLEAKWEHILTGRNELASKIVQAVFGLGNNSATGVLVDFENLSPSPHILILSPFLLSFVR